MWLRGGEQGLQSGAGGYIAVGVIYLCAAVRLLTHRHKVHEVYYFMTDLEDVIRIVVGRLLGELSHE
jgi:hypothetical protein